MVWSRDYIDITELYDKSSSFEEKCACIDALRASLPSDVRNLNTGWMSAGLPYRYKSAWKIIKLVSGSSGLSELRLKAEVEGTSFSKSELRYLIVLLLIYRFNWLYEWPASDRNALDAAAGFALSDFLSEKAARNE